MTLYLRAERSNFKAWERLKKSATRSRVYWLWILGFFMSRSLTSGSEGVIGYRWENIFFVFFGVPNFGNGFDHQRSFGALCMGIKW